MALASIFLATGPNFAWTTSPPWCVRVINLSLLFFSRTGFSGGMWPLSCQWDVGEVFWKASEKIFLYFKLRPRGKKTIPLPPLCLLESPWRRVWQPTPIFLPGEFHGQRSLEGYQSMGSQRVRHDWVINIHTKSLSSHSLIQFYTVTPEWDYKRIMWGLFVHNY